MEFDLQFLKIDVELSATLVKEGGQFVEEILGAACAAQQADNETECLMLFKEAKDMSWEKIHSGAWRDVALVWREVYSLCSLGETAVQLSTKHCPRDLFVARMEKALKALDMSLLLGSPKYSTITNSFIEKIDAKLSAHEKKQFVSAATTTTERQTTDKQHQTQTRTQTEAQPTIKHPMARVSQPELMNFAQRFHALQQPVIITNAIDHWPAMGKTSPDRCWSNLEYLKRIAGRRTVPVELGNHYLSDDWATELMTLAQFIDEHVIPSLSSSQTTDGKHTTTAQTETHAHAQSHSHSHTSAQAHAQATAPTHAHTPTQTQTQPSRKRTRDDAHSEPHKDADTRAHAHTPAPLHTDKHAHSDKDAKQTDNMDTSTDEKTEKKTDSTQTRAHANVQQNKAQNKPNKKLGYLAQHQLFEQIPALRKDIAVPEYCALGEDPDVRINAWFGPKGTVSPLHHDPEHNFLAQVVGSKYIRLYSPEHSSLLYPNLGSITSNTSLVDVENVDREQFPLFESAPYTECILQPGEMLYMPPKWWHYVRSLSVSFSVSFWWH